MTPDEWKLLTALIDRVKAVPSQQKDPEAEQALRQLSAERPDALYILAQTVIMQDFALRNAQGQIEDMQRQLSETAPPPQRQGSFLGGLFGGGPASSSQQPAGGSVPRVNPWSRQDDRGSAYSAPPPPPSYGAPPMQTSQTGDFLRGAATTAVGVAGGALLFDGVRSLFGGHSGMMGGFGGMQAPGSLSETTVVNNYYDQEPGQEHHAGDSHPSGQEGWTSTDYDPDSDPDFGGVDDDSSFA